VRRESVRGRLLVSTLLLGGAVPVGCAAQYEEPAGTQPDSAREQLGAAEQEPAMDEAPTAARSESAESLDRSLDDIEVELVRNEAKLRALGVALPGRAATGETNLGGELAPTPERTQPSGGGATATPKPKPDARPSTAPGPSGEPGSATKQGRADKPAKKRKSEDADEKDRFANPPPGAGGGAGPSEAKATPLSPTEQPQLDAATRCVQVCELSEITCELGVQICELAQRHADDQDYEQACARATDDCDAAQEACDECAG
jgi:hypothetical protein